MDWSKRFPHYDRHVIVPCVEFEEIINVHSKSILPHTHIEVFSRLYRGLAQSEIYLVK